MGLDLDESEIEEFKCEAAEMLDECEAAFIDLEKGADFSASYDAIFRVFHSLKGGAGMTNMPALRDHMHHLENTLTQTKDKGEIPAKIVSYLLTGIDSARQFLEEGTLEFTIDPSIGASIQSSPSDEVDEVPPEAPPTPAPTESSTQEDAAPAQESPEKEATTSPSELTGLVYLLDDEPEVVELLQEVVENVGLQARSFTSPTALLEALKDGSPDVVFTDMNMPELSGLDILKKVKDFDPTIPVIFISGFISRELLIEAIQHDLYAAVEKPIDQKLLLTHCRNAIRFRRSNKILDRSIHLLIYQLSDLGDFLKEKGRDDIWDNICSGMKEILDNKRELKNLSKGFQ